jgi:hypothetical protein
MRCLPGTWGARPIITAPAAGPLAVRRIGRAARALTSGQNDGRRHGSHPCALCPLSFGFGRHPFGCGLGAQIASHQGYGYDQERQRQEYQSHADYSNDQGLNHSIGVQRALLFPALCKQKSDPASRSDLQRRLGKVQKYMYLCHI